MIDFICRVLLWAGVIIAVAGGAIIWRADILPWLVRKGWLP